MRADSPLAGLQAYLAAGVIMVISVALGATLGVNILWLKAAHIIVVIAWFAGVFYLPRLFVYHSMIAKEDTAGHDRFVIMERKLYRFVTPFMLLTVFFGGWMLYEYGAVYLRTQTWLHVKLTLAAVVVGYHFYLGFLRHRFARAENVHSHRFYRVVNELPVLVLFAIVILVVVKPF